MIRETEYRTHWVDEDRDSRISFSADEFPVGAGAVISGWISPQSSVVNVFLRINEITDAVYDYRYTTANGVGNQDEERYWPLIEFGGDPVYGANSARANSTWLEIVVNSGTVPRASIGANGASLSVRPTGAVNTVTTTSGSISTSVSQVNSLQLWSDSDLTADLEVHEIYP